MLTARAKVGSYELLAALAVMTTRSSPGGVGHVLRGRTSHG
jgi:hypothetical protein